MTKQPSKPWLGKYQTLTDDDHTVLDSEAAINEFKLGMPKEAAEAAAHQAYLKGHALKAAAHHLLGMRMANTASHDDAAVLHSKAFEAAMKSAGLPTDKVPPELEEILKQGNTSLYNYKSHPADAFFLPQDENGGPDSSPQQPHPDNNKIKAVLEGLGKLQSLLKD